jgi:hypothetical protein
MGDPFDFEIDAEDEERWAQEWAEADRYAARVLAAAWPPALEDVPAPAGVTDPDALVHAVAETISPSGDPGLPIEEQASVYSLEHADWLALVVGLVRRGVGATFSAEEAVRDLDAMDEVDGAGVGEDEYVMPVEVLAPQWQQLGVLDADRGLTPAGEWSLPRALFSVWSQSEG